METLSALLALCAGNSPVTGEFSTQRPVTRFFDVFFDLRLNNAWVTTPKAGYLRRHRAHSDVIVMFQAHLFIIQHAHLNNDGWNAEMVTSFSGIEPVFLFSFYQKLSSWIHGPILNGIQN